MTDLSARLARKGCHDLWGSGKDHLIDDCRTCWTIAAAVREALGKAEKVVPANWLDPLLTGPNAILQGHGPWGCPDIERLLQKIVAAIAALRS